MVDFMTVVGAFKVQPILLALLACGAFLGSVFFVFVGVVHIVGMIRGEAYVKRMLSGAIAERRECRQRYDRENKNSKYKKYASRRRKIEK